MAQSCLKYLSPSLSNLKLDIVCFSILNHFSGKIFVKKAIKDRKFKLVLKPHLNKSTVFISKPISTFQYDKCVEIKLLKEIELFECQS